MFLRVVENPYWPFINGYTAYQVIKPSGEVVANFGDSQQVTAEKDCKTVQQEARNLAHNFVKEFNKAWDHQSNLRPSLFFNQGK